MNNKIPFVQVSDLKEGQDYYYDELGLLVFTKIYLQKRGTCCQNGCRHCPYLGSDEKSVDIVQKTAPTFVSRSRGPDLTDVSVGIDRGQETVKS